MGCSSSKAAMGEPSTAPAVRVPAPAPAPAVAPNALPAPVTAQPPVLAPVAISPANEEAAGSLSATVSAAQLAAVPTPSTHLRQKSSGGTATATVSPLVKPVKTAQPAAIVVAPISAPISATAPAALDFSKPSSPNSSHTSSKEISKFSTQELMVNAEAVGDLVKGDLTQSLPVSPTGSKALSRQQSFNTILSTAHPSLMLSDPIYLSTKINESFLHYARKKYENDSGDHHREKKKRDSGSEDDERIDKKGLGQLATDCVLSLLHAIRARNQWKQDKWEKKEREERIKYMPGDTLTQAVEIAKYYMQQELQYKSGGVTRTMFFFHFARAYKQMFSYDGKLTLERENLVVKWNKLGIERIEEKAKAKKEKEKEREHSGSRTSRTGKEKAFKHKHHRHTSSAGRKSGSRKNRATAPANSISELLNSSGITIAHDSKVMQAERKLTSTLSAHGGEKIREKVLGNRKSSEAR